MHNFWNNMAPNENLQNIIKNQTRHDVAERYIESYR